MESEEGNEKTRKKNGKCDRQHRSSLCDDRRNWYQAAVSGAQTDSTENSVKAQNTDQQESTDGSFSEEGTTQIGHGQPDAGIYGKCSHNDRGRSLCFIRGYREQRGCPV